MKILLTGAAGFIGGAIRVLAERSGHEVVAIDCYLPAAHGRVHPDPEVHRLDVREAADSEEWADLLRGVDVVCHQAAMVGAGVSVADLPAYAGINDLGTAALLAAMSRAGVDALVLASSMVVYGEGRYSCPDHGLQLPPPRTRADLEARRFENHCPACGSALSWEPVPEDAALDPRGSYAASKVAQEHYAFAWARQAGGRAVALRYHNVYGPLMPRDTPYSGVAAIFRSALERGRAPRVFEDGGQMRDFVHVDDVARANLLAVEEVVRRPSEAWSTYNVASGHPVPLLDVARILAAAADGPPPEVTGEYRIGDARHVVASPERAAGELGFRAAVGPEQGMAAFADAPLRG